MTQPDVEEAIRHLHQLRLYQKSDDIPKSAEEARVRMALVELGDVVVRD